MNFDSGDIDNLVKNTWDAYSVVRNEIIGHSNDWLNGKLYDLMIQVAFSHGRKGLPDHN